MERKTTRQILLEQTNRLGFPTQQEIANFLAKYYPEESAEDKLFHDHWGLYSKNPEGIVKRVLLCTTPTSTIIQFAKANKYDLVISHHDFLFNNPDVPQIIYHSAMDESENGHNVYFMRKLGLRNIQQYHKVLLRGDLYKTMTLEEFKNHLIRRGFEINGLVWESPNADNQISSVLYCSGMGGMLLGPNHIIDARNHPADVYVTGELTSNPANVSNNPFKYIIELGHTSSEKPLFKWVKNMIKNRWQNLEVDLADKEMDIWGTDTYKAKMARDLQYKKDWEERSKQYQNHNNINYNFDDTLMRGTYKDLEITEDHPLIMLLMNSDIDMRDIEDVANFLEYYYEPFYDNDRHKPRILNLILGILNDIDPQIAEHVRDHIELYFPPYDEIMPG